MRFIRFLLNIWAVDFIGKLIALLFLSAAAFLMWALFCLAYFVADTWGVETYEDRGEIIDSSHTPGFYTLTYSGNTPIQVWHPPAWRVKVKVRNQSDWESVKSGYYKRAQVGDAVDVICKQGRYSEGLHIVSIK